MSTPAAALIRDARRRAGMTQHALSRASGVAVSTLSAYENGQRDPGSATLGKVLRAAGSDLTSRPTRPTQSLHVEAVMQLVDALPQRAARDMGFPPFRTLLRP